jgi:hypothetical protein
VSARSIQLLIPPQELPIPGMDQPVIISVDGTLVVINFYTVFWAGLASRLGWSGFIVHAPLLKSINPDFTNPLTPPKPRGSLLRSHGALW